MVDDYDAFFLNLDGSHAKFDGEFTILCHCDKTLVVLFSEVLQLLDETRNVQSFIGQELRVALELNRVRFRYRQGL